MKGFSLKKRIMPLNSRGIAHFIAPLFVVLLVGVAGTYMLVASKAQTPSTKQSSASKKSYMIVYSESGAYDSVQIKLTGASSATMTSHSCGGSLDGVVTKNLPGGKKRGAPDAVFAPLKFSCSAIGGDAAYLVSFGKNKKFDNANRVAVDVDEGYCTLVHANATLINKVPISKTGRCEVPTNVNDAPTKVDVAATLNAGLSKDKKSFSGYVDLATPGKDVTRSQCSGLVDVVIREAATPNQARHYKIPLKFVNIKGKNSYCTAKISATDYKPTVGNYTLVGEFPGNIYFNAANSNTVNVVKAAAAKKN